MLIDKCPIKLKAGETIRVAILKSLDNNWSSNMGMFNSGDAYIIIFQLDNKLYGIQNWRGPWPKYNTKVDDFINRYRFKNKLQSSGDMDFGYYAFAGTIGMTPHANASVYYTEMKSEDFNELTKIQNRISKLSASTATIEDRFDELKKNL